MHKDIPIWWEKEDVCRSYLHTSETWTSPKASVGTSVVLYVKYEPIGPFLQVFWRIRSTAIMQIVELSPKASFGISNDFVGECCSSTFKFVERTHENITYTSFVCQTKLIKTIIKICFVLKGLVYPKKKSQNENWTLGFGPITLSYQPG